MNKQRKTGVPLRAILLYICLCTFVVIGVTFSKYIATSGGGDEARVIKFEDISISEKGDVDENGKFILTPDVNTAKKAVVNFGGSEAAAYVFLEVTSVGFEYDSEAKAFCAVPYGEDEEPVDGHKYKINIRLNDEFSDDNSGWNYLTNENGKYIFYMELEPNTALTDFPIIKDGEVAVDWKLKNSELKKLGKLSISFKASAVQRAASGEAAALDAWDAFGGNN